jgi:hypothetical protein
LQAQTSKGEKYNTQDVLEEERTAEKLDYLKRSGRPLLHNGYNKSGVCIVIWVTIVNAFTRQRIHRQIFPAHRGRIFRYSEENKTFEKVFSNRLAKDCLMKVQAHIGTAVKKTEWSVE